jgi:ankyrin repeat protein
MYPTVIDIEKIKKLVEMGANLNLQNKTGETVLMWESNYEIFKYLLEAGADPNISNNQGYTPLIKHVWREGYAELLIKFGANINHQAVNGITALMTSLKPKLMLRHTIPSKSPREFLIKAGANVNLQDNEGKTALMFAIRRNNFDLVEQLIHAGADVNIRDIYGRSSMDYLQAAH